MDRFQAALANRLENKTAVSFEDTEIPVDLQSPHTTRRHQEQLEAMEKALLDAKQLAEEAKLESKEQREKREKEEQEKGGSDNNKMRSFEGLSQQYTKTTLENAAKNFTSSSSSSSSSLNPSGVTSSSSSSGKFSSEANQLLDKAAEFIKKRQADPLFRRIAEKTEGRRENNAMCIILSASNFSRSVLSLHLERRGWTCVCVSRTTDSELGEKLAEAQKKFTYGQKALKFAGQNKSGFSKNEDQKEKKGGGGEDNTNDQFDFDSEVVPRVRLLLIDSFTHELPDDSARRVRILCGEEQERRDGGGNKKKKKKKHNNNNNNNLTNSSFGSSSGEQGNESENEQNENEEEKEKKGDEKIVVVQLTQIRADGGRGLQLPNFVEPDRAAIERISPARKKKLQQLQKENEEQAAAVTRQLQHGRFGGGVVVVGEGEDGDQKRQQEQREGKNNSNNSSSLNQQQNQQNQQPVTQEELAKFKREEEEREKRRERDLLHERLGEIDLIVRSAFTATLAEKVSSFFLTESARSRARVLSVSSAYDSIRGILGGVSSRRFDGGDSVVGQMFDCFAPSSEIIKAMFTLGNPQISSNNNNNNNNLQQQQQQNNQRSSSSSSSSSFPSSSSFITQQNSSGDETNNNNNNNNNNTISISFSDNNPNDSFVQLQQQQQQQQQSSSSSSGEGAMPATKARRQSLRNSKLQIQQAVSGGGGGGGSNLTSPTNASLSGSNNPSFTNFFFGNNNSTQSSTYSPPAAPAALVPNNSNTNNSNTRNSPLTTTTTTTTAEEATAKLLQNAVPQSVDPVAFLNFETDPRFVILRAHYQHMRSLLERFKEESKGKDRRIRKMQDEIGTLSEEVKNLHAEHSGVGIAALLTIPKDSVDCACSTHDFEELKAELSTSSWLSEKQQLLEKVRRSEVRVRSLQDRVSSQANTIAANHIEGSTETVSSMRSKIIDLEEKVQDLKSERDLLKEVAGNAQEQYFKMTTSQNARLHSQLKSNPVFASDGESRRGSMRSNSSSAASAYSPSSSISAIGNMMEQLKKQSNKIKKTQKIRDRMKEILCASESQGMFAHDFDANKYFSPSSAASPKSRRGSRKSSKTGSPKKRRGGGGNNDNNEDGEDSEFSGSNSNTYQDYHHYHHRHHRRHHHHNRRKRSSSGSRRKERDGDNNNDNDSPPSSDLSSYSSSSSYDSDDNSDNYSDIDNNNGSETGTQIPDNVSTKSGKRGRGSRRSTKTGGTRPSSRMSTLTTKTNNNNNNTSKSISLREQRRRYKEEAEARRKRKEDEKDREEELRQQEQRMKEEREYPANVDPALLDSERSFHYPDEKCLDRKERPDPKLKNLPKDQYGRPKGINVDASYLKDDKKKKKKNRKKKDRKSKNKRRRRRDSLSSSSSSSSSSSDSDSSCSNSSDSDSEEKRKARGGGGESETFDSMHEASQSLVTLTHSLESLFQQVVDQTETAAYQRKQSLDALYKAVERISLKQMQVNDVNRIHTIRVEIDELQRKLDSILVRPLGAESGSMQALRQRGEEFFKLYKQRYYLVGELRRLEENCSVQTHSRHKEQILRKLLSAQSRIDEVGNYLLNNNELFMYAESRMDVYRLHQELAPWITSDEYELLLREGKSAIQEMITKCQVARSLVDEEEGRAALESSFRIPQQQQGDGGRRNTTRSSNSFANRRTSAAIPQLAASLAGSIANAANRKESTLGGSSSSSSANISSITVLDAEGNEKKEGGGHEEVDVAQFEATARNIKLGDDDDDDENDASRRTSQEMAGDLEKEISRFVLDEGVEAVRDILGQLQGMWRKDQISGSPSKNVLGHRQSVASPPTSPTASPRKKSLFAVTSAVTAATSTSATSAAGGGVVGAHRSSTFSTNKKRQSHSSPQSPSFSPHSPTFASPTSSSSSPSSSSFGNNHVFHDEHELVLDEQARSLQYIIRHWKNEAMSLVHKTTRQVNKSIEEFFEKEREAKEFIEAAGFDIRPHNRRIAEKLLHDPFSDETTGAKPLIDPSATNIRIISVVEAFREASLVLHGQLKRLLLELKKRTPLKKVKIVDYATEQLLYRKKRIRQANEFPALMAVDAQLIGRFADYLEHETKGQYLLARSSFKSRQSDMMRDASCQTNVRLAIIDEANRSLLVESLPPSPGAKRRRQSLSSPSSNPLTAAAAGADHSSSLSLGQFSPTSPTSSRHGSNDNNNNTGNKTPQQLAFQNALAQIGATSPGAVDLAANLKAYSTSASPAASPLTSPLSGNRGLGATNTLPFASFGADGGIQVTPPQPGDNNNNFTLAQAPTSIFLPQLNKQQLQQQGGEVEQEVVFSEKEERLLSERQKEKIRERFQQKTKIFFPDNSEIKVMDDGARIFVIEEEEEDEEEEEEESEQQAGNSKRSGTRRKSSILPFGVVNNDDQHQQHHQQHQSQYRLVLVDYDELMEKNKKKKKQENVEGEKGEEEEKDKKTKNEGEEKKEISESNLDKEGEHRSCGVQCVSIVVQKRRSLSLSGGGLVGRQNRINSLDSNYSAPESNNVFNNGTTTFLPSLLSPKPPSVSKKDHQQLQLLQQRQEQQNSTSTSTSQVPTLPDINETKKRKMSPGQIRRLKEKQDLEDRALRETRPTGDQILFSSLGLDGQDSSGNNNNNNQGDSSSSSSIELSLRHAAQVERERQKQQHDQKHSDRKSRDYMKYLSPHERAQVAQLQLKKMKSEFATEARRNNGGDNNNSNNNNNSSSSKFQPFNLLTSQNQNDRVDYSHLLSNKDRQVPLNQTLLSSRPPTTQQETRETLKARNDILHGTTQVSSTIFGDPSTAESSSFPTEAHSVHEKFKPLTLVTSRPVALSSQTRVSSSMNHKRDQALQYKLSIVEDM